MANTVYYAHFSSSCYNLGNKVGHKSWPHCSAKMLCLASVCGWYILFSMTEIFRQLFLNINELILCLWGDTWGFLRLLPQENNGSSNSTVLKQMEGVTVCKLFKVNGPDQTILSFKSCVIVLVWINSLLAIASLQPLSLRPCLISSFRDYFCICRLCSRQPTQQGHLNNIEL